MRLLLLLLALAHSWGAVTLLTHTGAGGLNNDVTTSPIDTTGATLLVIVEGRAGAVVTPTDSKGNTWTKLNTVTGVAISAIYYSANPTVGTGHTFTVTGSGNFPALTVAAFSGVVAVSPFDQQSVGDTGTVTSIQPHSVTPSENNELIVTGLEISGVVGSLAVDSSFTIIDNIPFVNSNSFGVALAYLVQGTAAAVNPTWSWTTSTNVACTIATFKASASATIKHKVTNQ